LIWVLAVVVVGLIAVLAELLLSYQKRAHDLRSKQEPLRRRIREHTSAMQEAVGGIQTTAADQVDYLQGELGGFVQKRQQLSAGLDELERVVFGDGYDPNASADDDDEELIKERDAEAAKKVDEEDTPEELLPEARHFFKMEVEGHASSLQRDLDVVKRTLALLENKLRRGLTASKPRK